MYMQPMSKYELLGSFLLFTRVFYKLRTGREFKLSTPIGRESHYITIATALTRTINPNDIIRLVINCPPRYGKTELLIHFVAWAMARYPDSNFLYISYSHLLAKKQTQTIRQIMNLPEYKKLFGVQLTKESSAKDNFETTAGGAVYASGASGTVTGRGAGIQNCDRFGGAIVIDDIHKPKEVSSETIRKEILNWYKNTLQSRTNSPTTPIIFIGQRLHEDDLPSNLLKSYDGFKWDSVILKAMGTNGHALHPTMHDEKKLAKMQEVMPYEYSAQYQQDPQPSGGGIFKKDWFVLLEDEPDIFYTFITVDTAETDKTYNDATVFSFWGIYKIKDHQIETDIIGIHWLNCYQCWVEPKDLESEFLQFYARAMAHKVRPAVAAIEKKSTGTTLVSILSDMRGIHIRDIERTKASGSKIERFLAIQSIVAAKRLSLPAYAEHTQQCVTHMTKITANNSHRYDDIADTCADAIQLSIIDKTIGTDYTFTHNPDLLATKYAQHLDKLKQARQNRWLGR